MHLCDREIQCLLIPSVRQANKLHLLSVCTIVQHSGKGHCNFLETHNSDLSKYESLKPINTRFRMIDNVGDISECAKNHSNRLHVGGPTQVKLIYLLINKKVHCGVHGLR